MIVFVMAIAVFVVVRISKNRRRKKRAARIAQAVAPAVYTVSPADLARQQKEREKAAREAERIAKQRQREEEAARKAREAADQAEAEIPFLISQIDSLMEMLWTADADLQAARQACEHDEAMNKNGAVVTGKAAAKHKAERDKLARRVLQLENAIHAKEIKLNKAQQIAQN